MPVPADPRPVSYADRAKGNRARAHPPSTSTATASSTQTAFATNSASASTTGKQHSAAHQEPSGQQVHSTHLSGPQGQHPQLPQQGNSAQGPQERSPQQGPHYSRQPSQESTQRAPAMEMATPLAIFSSPTPPSAPYSSPSPAKPPVVNVWTLRAARRAAPQPPLPEAPRAPAPPPPPPPPRDEDDDPFIVRLPGTTTPRDDPWPAVGRANPKVNGTHASESENNKASRPASPPPPAPQLQPQTPQTQTAPPQNAPGSSKKTGPSPSHNASPVPANANPVPLGKAPPPPQAPTVPASQAPAKPSTPNPNPAPKSDSHPSPAHPDQPVHSASASGAVSPSSGALSPMPGFSGVPTPAFSGAASPSVGFASGARSPAMGGAPSTSQLSSSVSLSMSASSSAFPTPAESGAVSPALLSGAASPAKPPFSSGSATRQPETPSRARPRKWVPIPPEELRAAAEQQQRANGHGHGHGHENRQGYAYGREREGYGGRSGGRRLHTHSQSQSQSGTTSRAESVVSAQDRDGPPQVHQHAPHVQQRDEEPGPPPQQHQQQWGYMPPPPPPPQHMYAPPPHYYGQGPYGYEPAPYVYWGHPGVGPGMGGQAEEGQGQGQQQWWTMPLVPAQDGPEQQQQQPQDARQEEQEPARATPPERPPPPAESGAVSVSASLSALGGMGNGAPGGVVFGSVESGLAALGGTTANTTLSQSASANANANVNTNSNSNGGQPFAAGLVLSSTMAVLRASSPAPPPVLPASVSAPPREAAWRTAAEPVWPVDPGWTPTAWPTSTSTSNGGRPPVIAIGVSPGARARRLADDPDTDVVDLTVAPSELAGRWEFGTTRVAEQRGYGAYPYGVYGGGPGGGFGYDGQSMYGGYAPPPPPPMDGMMPPPQGMMPPMGMMVGPPPPMMGMGGYGMPPPPQIQGMMPPANGGAPIDGEGGPPSSSPRVGAGAVMNGNGGSGERRQGDSSEWEVKDFGYGFGGPYARDEPRIPYVPRREPEHPPHQEDRPPRDMEYPPTGRPRRGSYNGGGYGYEPRGTFGGRRARGGFRGAGRFGRGGFQQQGRPPLAQQPPQAPSFSITPPPHFTPLVPEGYYPTPYIPTSYDYAQPPASHLAPVPTLRTRLSFPIDRLRQEILSQLEFYLSPDNMATDLYLRQQMDSQGWVRIEVLASFKRVQSKTSDVNLVRDVLGLSDYAEIRGEWVRSTEGWERFVLPTARPSVVDAESPYSMLLHADKAGHAHADDAEEVDEEDEEDVVFVMGREAQAWSPERPR